MKNRERPAGMAEWIDFNRTRSINLMTNNVAQTSSLQVSVQWSATQCDNPAGQSSTASSCCSQNGQNRVNRQFAYSQQPGITDGWSSLSSSDLHVPTPCSRVSTLPSCGPTISVAPACDSTSTGFMVPPLDQHGTWPATYDPSSLRSPQIRDLTCSPNFEHRRTTEIRVPSPPFASDLQGSSSSNYDGVRRSKVALSSMIDAPPTTLEKDKSNDFDGTRWNNRGPLKMTAANMREKRYRINLNDKIVELRESVPSLRIKSKRKGSSEDVIDLGQDEYPKAHKITKATVLSKAIEYIQRLEKRNKKLQDDLDALNKQIASYEMVAMNSFFAFP